MTGVIDYCEYISKVKAGTWHFIAFDYGRKSQLEFMCKYLYCDFPSPTLFIESYKKFIYSFAIEG